MAAGLTAFASSDGIGPTGYAGGSLGVVVTFGVTTWGNAATDALSATTMIGYEICILA